MDYSFKQSIGKGAYATVREAVHNSSRRRVAIKSYDKRLLTSVNKQRNIANEIKITRQIKHEYIISSIEAINDAKHVHIVMELVEGAPLSQYLKSFP